MLTYLLALAVALGSFGLYMSAFFYPEIYRKGDLTLSGIGLFYALVLWICADRITGGVLLGQIASVSLIGWFGYQALTARLGYTPSTAELQAKFSEVLNSEKTAKVADQGKRLFSTVKDRAQALLNKEPAAPTTSAPYQPLKREDFGNPTPDANKPDVMGTIGAVGGAIGSLFKKPEKNQEVYVRKDFREEAPKAEPVTSTPITPTEDEDFGFEEDTIAQTPTLSEPADIAGTSDSTTTADEIVQEEVAYEAHSNVPHLPHPPAPEQVEAAVADAEVPSNVPHPPHPPTPEQVEAAVADAEEKNLPSDPPATDSELSAPAEHSESESSL